MAATVYKDRQTYDNPIVFIGLGLAILGLLYLFVRSLVLDPVHWVYPGVCLGVAGLLGGLWYFLRRLSLRVKVSEKYIKYRVQSALHRRKRRIPWKEVERWSLIKTPVGGVLYPAATGHGGETFVSLTGRNGLAILTRAGRRYFIGCEDVDALREALVDYSVCR
jgi:hypothetical protein